MNITFILPGHGKNPVGGFKVVYEYANRLLKRGHSITIVHPAILDTDTPIIAYPKKLARYIQRAIDKSYLPRAWFDIEQQVEMLWVPSLHQRHIPNADVIIATAWQTAEWVATYPNAKGLKYYLIQDVEDWSGELSRVMRTWTLPLKKIVISKWLQNTAKELGQDSIYIPNGLDFALFNIDNDIAGRKNRSVMMLNHTMERKGIADGLAALDIVRQVHPDIKVTMFGIPKGNHLQEWVTYYQNPSQRLLRELYNNTSVFLAPSRLEGWGLTASEAMMCGAAVVGTDIGGHREFMEDGVTALLAPPKDPSALANRLLQLFYDEDLRINIASNGNKFIQQFTWTSACDKLERALAQAVESMRGESGL